MVAVAVVGGAVASAGIGAAVSSGATKTATRVSEETRTENNALSRETRDINTATLAPFVQQGGQATAYINQLLGIQPAPAATFGGGGGSASRGAYDTPGYGDGAGGYIDRFNDNTARQFEDRGYVPPNYAAQIAGAAPQQGGQPLAPGAASAGLDLVRNSSAYQFRRQEGERGIVNNRAVSGLLNSGSALKSLSRFQDGLAAQAEDTYFNRLAGQQGVGLSAASAQAGVANNYSAQVQNSNSTNATNVGNAAIARSNSINNGLNGIVNAGAYAYGARG